MGTASEVENPDAPVVSRPNALNYTTRQPMSFKAISFSAGLLDFRNPRRLDALYNARGIFSRWKAARGAEF
jgi:hypothetical protein